MSRFIFSQTTPKKLAELASDYVEQHRQEQSKRLNDAKLYLVSSSSVLRSLILTASKRGETKVAIDFVKLNENSQFGNFDFLFNVNELDELLITSTEYLEKEGCNYTVEGSILIVTWPTPKNLQLDQPLESPLE
jgi:hypothetical protein